jgi:hypothetical protein
MSTDTIVDEASSSTSRTSSQQSAPATNLQDPAVASNVPTHGTQMAATAVSQSHVDPNTETTSTDVESSRCCIMELPTELRLMIYEEVFQDVLSGCPLSYPLRPG